MKQDTGGTDECKLMQKKFWKNLCWLNAVINWTYFLGENEARKEILIII